ncbi:MAG: DUF465 domain-containing protein [Rhizobiaceae bacterium]
MWNHLAALWARHSILDAKIDREQRVRSPDGLRLKMLKKLRLKLRDRIAAVEDRISRKSNANRTSRAG